jgi:hypothetical protein
MRSSFAFRVYEFHTRKKTAAMTEHSAPLEQEFGSRDSDPADPVVANLQESANLANENCDRVLALAQTLSAQLREAQARINQLEREAEGLGGQLLAEAKIIIEEARSNADARVNRTIREADERVDRLKADAQHEIGRLQNELTQATREIEQIKDEAGTRIESVKKEADARVDAMETEAKKRIDVIRRDNEDKVLCLEADLTEAKDRADHAERWLMLIRREIEDHLVPAMRDGPKPTNSAARPRSLTLPAPSRSSVSTWFRRLWLRVTSIGCRVHADIELATSFLTAPQHEPEFSNGLSVRKTGNTATASEPSAPLRSGGNSAGLSSVIAGSKREPKTHPVGPPFS